MSRIAFIGLGNMGGPMAANLVKNGHSVRVFDLVPAAVQAAVDAGASAASSARDTLADAEVVISMLPASRHVEGVYLGDDGILAAEDYIHGLSCHWLATDVDLIVAKHPHEMKKWTCAARNPIGVSCVIHCFFYAHEFGQRGPHVHCYVEGGWHPVANWDI